MQPIDSHRVFLASIGMFGVVHWLMYVFWWPTPAYWSTHLIGISGLWLLMQPYTRIPLFGLIAGLVIDGWLQAPVFSNHTMLKNWVALGLLVAGIETLIRRKSVDWFIERFAPYGAMILIGMYFFGVFHKINTDFIDPSVSCAVALWQAMPIPMGMKESEFWHGLGIYGTFVIETVIAVCILVPRLRHMGVFIGIGFHMLLASSGYEYYATFSLLTVSLHTLFLDPKLHKRFLEAPRFLRALNWLKSPVGRLAFSAYLGLFAFATIGGQPVAAGLLGFGYVGPLLWALWNFRTGPTQIFGLNELRSIWIPLLVLAFYLSGFSPYLGMKTSQSFNMFANLQLEGGQSNHLLVEDAPDGYLRDLVFVESFAGVPWFATINKEGLYLVYYDFLNHMERAGPGARATDRLNDGPLVTRTRDELQPEFDRILHPRWVRKWFHFNPVDLRHPKPCAVNR